ncbi:hypothetical protein K440DRAFT_642313 [Wilcoxina mikolae CBS 423.85]|nr:hypothetical protein K440DRAFT_642313 [Wilcoxina mikolae CBS 423.85]
MTTAQKDYGCAGAPILSVPSPAPVPSPASQSALLQILPPAQPSHFPALLLSPELLTQLMWEVSEHLVRSRQYGVNVSLPPPAPSPRKVHPQQTTCPPPAERKARMLE